jgi:hypothetical protein
MSAGAHGMQLYMRVRAELLHVSIPIPLPFHSQNPELKILRLELLPETRAAL